MPRSQMLIPASTLEHFESLQREWHTTQAATAARILQVCAMFTQAGLPPVLPADLDRSHPVRFAPRLAGVSIQELDLMARTTRQNRTDTLIACIERVYRDSTWPENREFALDASGERWPTPRLLEPDEKSEQIPD